jgi:L-Ala-D/L-Glu epimerase
MKITDIRVRLEKMELTRPYTIAYRTVNRVENLIVEIDTQDGRTGFGAANLSPAVVGMSTAEAYDLLSTGEALAPLLGEDVRELRRLCEQLGEWFPNAPGAWVALDLALHDLFAQGLGIPLVRYLGQRHARMLTSITIGIKDVTETLEEAEEYQQRGFRILKVKLGHDVDEDIVRLEALRQRFGPEMGIRVDANQGYIREELLHFWEATRALGLELIEQPLPKGEVAALRQLPAELRRHLAADEALLSPADAFTLAQGDPACGIFNIKLMKCGGIAPALRIAGIAAQASIELMWGCNDESRISIAAALHVALACPHTRYLDLDGHLDLARNIVSGGFRLEAGYLYPLDRPGLGLARVSG